MRIIATSIDEYLLKSGEYEPELRELDELIQQHAPALKREFFDSGTFSAVGYGVIPYQSKTMKQPGKWPILALTAQKNYMALYACALIDGEYIAEIYTPKLGKANIGKSCIRYKKLSDLSQEGLIEMLRDINTRFEKGEKLYG